MKPVRMKELPPTYYHGGPAGRARGAYILPPSVTKAETTADFGASGVCKRDKVYITTSYDAAVLYAAGSKRGVVYEVSPIGDLSEDQDCSQPGLSFECDKAVVLKVRKPSHDEIRMARAVLVMP